MFVRILTVFGALQYRSARLDRCRFDSSYTFAVTVFESQRYWHKTCIVKFFLVNAAYVHICLDDHHWRERGRKRSQYSNIFLIANIAPWTLHPSRLSLKYRQFPVLQKVKHSNDSLSFFQPLSSLQLCATNIAQELLFIIIFFLIQGVLWLCRPLETGFPICVL